MLKKLKEFLEKALKILKRKRLKKKEEELETWEQIAFYLKVSKATAQRRARLKEDPLPVYKRGGTIVAYKSELDEWTKRYEKEIQAETKSKNKRFLIFSITIFTILLAATMGFLIRREEGKVNGENSKLIDDLSLLDTVATLKIYSEDGKLVKKINYNFITQNSLTTSCRFVSERPPFYAKGDVNGDKLEDIVVINPEDKTELELFLQTEKHTLILAKKRVFNIKHLFEGSLYDISVIKYVCIGDVDGDGKNDILLTLVHSTLYPSCLLVLDGNLDIKFRLFHPGWLYYTDVKDLNHDGKNEIYVAGTNNYIYKPETGEEIAIGIEGNIEGKSLDLFGPKMTMFHAVPRGLKLSYARLNFLEKWKPRFQIPKVIKNNSKMNVKDSFVVAGGVHLEKKGDYAVQTFLRCFYFGYLLKFKYGFWEYENLAYLGIKFTKEEDRNLLIPHYWNGKSWQNSWCLVPQR